MEKLIQGTKDKLILISPYLQFTDRIKEHLGNLNIQKRDIRIVYRENKLQLEENNWLESQIGIRTSLCKNLHAKCYINENEAIITSMNLYEFSQQNNNEMGVYISKSEDADLYEATLEEAQRLLTISEEIRVTVKKVTPDTPPKTERKSSEVKSSNIKSMVNKSTGFCIRTGVPIPFDILRPFTYDAFKKWDEHKNDDFPEKFCHFSGEHSDGQTSKRRPVLGKNWKKAEATYGPLSKLG